MLTRGSVKYSHPPSATLSTTASPSTAFSSRGSIRARYSLSEPSGKTTRPAERAFLPEKWAPVFRKDFMLKQKDKARWPKAISPSSLRDALAGGLRAQPGAASYGGSSRRTIAGPLQVAERGARDGVDTGGAKDESAYLRTAKSRGSDASTGVKLAEVSRTFPA